MKRTVVVFLALAFLPAVAGVSAATTDPSTGDAYEQYVMTSRDFQRVKQDKDWCHAAYPSWTYMPWTYQWTTGYTDESGRWSSDHGYNGAFLDHGEVNSATSKTGKLDWINQFKFRFYVDHVASKHYLHLWDGGDLKPHLAEIHGNGIRPTPVNAAMLVTLKEIISRQLQAVKTSPQRAAYALDDEISWGHFVHPCMWCVTDEKSAYANWLREIYGPGAPLRDHWITYDDIRPKLKTWSLAEFDASPLMDQWTFNDSYWNNFVGDLVEYTNSVDPATPCGFVGGQCPDAFGGYDYAKIMRKVQYIESYNIGSSQAIIRSFNPRNAIPAVTSHFHRTAEDDVWQTWYYLAHGNRGFIGWVEAWFDGDKPKPWHDEVAPHYLEAAKKIGPLMAKAEWIHDGVAVYYSHASIQLGWILDAEAHGKTWTQRNGDERLGASHMVRHAWENMLRDSGIQYNFISYVDVIQKGIPKDYKVLILPACLCLSDVEAKRIEAFCRDGGTVIADYMPGLWDQHGKGRHGGVLDEMFGVKHDGNLRSQDVFGGTLWCEIDQDANFSWKTYQEFMTNKNTCVQDASGFDKAVRKMAVDTVNSYGKGKAILMNLSPQWYNAYRVTGFEASRKRDVFIHHVVDAGISRWVYIKNAGETEHGYEITYWRKDGRTIVYLCLNPEVAGSQLGGGNAVGLKTQSIRVKLCFPAEIKNVRNERTGESLENGNELDLDWSLNQAAILSFTGKPPRRP